MAGGAREWGAGAADWGATRLSSLDVDGAGDVDGTLRVDTLQVGTPDGYSGEEFSIKTYHVSTTDGTTNMDTVVHTLDANQHIAVVTIKCVAAQDTGDNWRSFYVVQSFKRTGGTVGSLTAHASDTKNAGNGTTLTTAMLTSGDDIVFRIRGNASENWEWTFSVTVQEGGYTS